MKTYLIGYDLKTGQDYDKLIEAIKNLGSWWHCLDSTWLVKSNSSAVQICNHLLSYMDQNDKILVAQVSGDAAWFGFSGDCASWLKSEL